jgi:hypothetical protein
VKPSELLSSPEKWTKGADARNSNGNIVYTNSDDASCFCLRGAVILCRISLPTARTKLRAALTKLYPTFSDYVDFNDHPDTTFEDVQKVLKEAGL